MDGERTDGERRIRRREGGDEGGRVLAFPPVAERGEGRVERMARGFAILAGLDDAGLDLALRLLDAAQAAQAGQRGQAPPPSGGA